LYEILPIKIKEVTVGLLQLCCVCFTEEEIEVYDLFPDYDEDEDDDQCMITIKEAMCALEVNNSLLSSV
jgi:hypothetical protein